MVRAGLTSVLLLLGLCATVSARDLLLLGAPIRRSDYVAGTVLFVKGRDVAIDMGFVEGVVPGHRFRVFRRQGDDFRLVGICVAGLVQRRQTMVTVKTTAAVRAGDAVVIAARELVIWSPTRGLIEDERLRRQVARPRHRGYDTRESQLDEIDLLERRRSNRLKLREWSRRLTEARPKGPALWDLTRAKSRRKEFITTLVVFGGSFRYRNRDERENASFNTVVQAINAAEPEAGVPYDAPPVDSADAPAAEADADDSPNVPRINPRRVPRVFRLARRVSEYLGRARGRF
ncbi:MAG: hypothetical protein VB859_08665 [Planctomycetaceae bacterium]